jgi:hypothetical protein
MVEGDATDESSASYLSINGSMTAHAKSGKLTTLLIECRDPRHHVAKPPVQTAPVVASPTPRETSEPDAPSVGAADGGSSIVTKSPF